MSSPWIPTTTLDARRSRARLYAAVRDFFSSRGVLEVDTPQLSSAATLDPALASWQVSHPDEAGCYREIVGADSDAGFPVQSGSDRRGYLNTSPEFAMKRLLASGSGDIFQIAHAFRAGEQGCWHNPEFTLLEWYRLDFDDARMMAEVEEFLFNVLAWDSHWRKPQKTVVRISYRCLFESRLGIDPLDSSLEDLARIARAVGLDVSGNLDREGWLDALLALYLIPQFPDTQLTFVHHYPEDQAILARPAPEEPGYARRFELFWGAVELANGFHELTSLEILDARAEKDCFQREASGLPVPPRDMLFRAAMEAGLPDCSGVAVGLDRLLMRALGSTDIREVLDFPWGNS